MVVLCQRLTTDRAIARIERNVGYCSDGEKAFSGLSLGDNSTLADLSAGTNAAAISAAKDDPYGQTLALLGHYMASSFVLPSDGHSGTPITEPQEQQHHLSLPHAG